MKRRPPNPHQYAPRVVRLERSIEIRPACSCGWIAERREYDDAAKSVWKRHFKTQEITHEEE